MRPNPEPLRSGLPVARLALALAITALMSGCAHGPPPGDDAPTLQSLADRRIELAKDKGIVTNDDQTMTAYRQFLAGNPPEPQRAEALRRLGDLEMDLADQRAVATEAGVPDYQAAVARYQDYLKAYPQDPGNDRVLYQLARAHEQRGALEQALKTLDQLVQAYPQSAYRDEAQFRRGELLFSMRDYVKAEQAYASLLQANAQNPFRDRALSMQGWSLFKQGRLELALARFFDVLDFKLGGRSGGASLDSLRGLTRADRELLEDTLRVTSLGLASLQGAQSIAPYIDSELRRGYEFRIYQQLGELYLRQERAKDAADTFALFAQLHPLQPQAPQLQARVIETYQQAGLATLALEAKKDYVARYGMDSAFWRANPLEHQRIGPLVKNHLDELARHYHASAQKSHRSADYQEAVRWYRVGLAAFANDPDAAQNQFLLAELLFEDGHLAEAAVEYEAVAYARPLNPRNADAGYAALLAYAGQEKTATATERAALQRSGVASALRFAKAFAADPRTAGVLSHAAETLYALNDAEAAAAVAAQVLALGAAAPAAQRRTAQTVIAHAAFDRGDFAQAEQAYGQVLAATPAAAAGRSEISERLAAAAYKQGEQARAAGQPREAVAHFARVASVAPQSSISATAQYDAAATLIGLKDWAGAARALEDFRQRYPNHPLQGEATAKLAVAYLEQQQWAAAAAEFERLAATQADPQLARGALWQAAELHERAGALRAAATAYERYLQPTAQAPVLALEPLLEARWRLAQIARQDKQRERELALARQVFEADQAAGGARTPRTRTLGAMAALTLAEPVFDGYAKVALVEPLQKSLKLKKAKMEAVLKAYALAADAGVAEVVTASAYQTAALYQDFGRALLASQRPRGLKKAELEQYNVMLEEQAFPFEERAIELHEANARRAAQGLYDEWVRRSFGALAQLRPLRWGKTELGGPDAPDLATLEQAAASPGAQAQQFNQLGVAQRRLGRFAQARQAYATAIERDPRLAAPLLNLAILNDLYLDQRESALALYQSYLALVPADPTVTKWIADLNNRKSGLAAAARKEAP